MRFLHARQLARERMDRAKAKMERVVHHFLYLLELHENNVFIVYSPGLSSQIPEFFAANAFNVFQRGCHQVEIVRLCALWDKPKVDKENITVIDLIDAPSAQSAAAGASLSIMNNKTVLISGAGITGPTLAFWLKAAGFEPTLIERAPALRTGG